jgi:hypothetical protein
MSVPLNQNDYERFQALAESIMKNGEGEISIYTSHEHRGGKCYVSIEMKSNSLPAEDLERIFKSAPLPASPAPVRDSERDYTV